MNENLFQFIWQYALFETRDLQLEDGRPLTIIHRGQLNTDAGPDFTEARLRIEQTTWAGNIELHLKESDWLKHAHNRNPRYQNIILHVVLEKDMDQSPGNFPVLCLKDRIRPALIAYYEQLMRQQQHIACGPGCNTVPALLWSHWQDRLLIERWEQKAAVLEEVLHKNQNDWRSLLYYSLTANLGTRANTAAFNQLAVQTPLNVLARHREQLSHIEAILFGQAGLIPEPAEDPYSIELSIHYAFFRQKYGLKAMEPHTWKFLRMRPAHFPTIRIAQLAMLLHQSHDLFQKFVGATTSREIGQLLTVDVSPYWQEHYTFGKPSVKRQKHLGKSMIDNIIINTIAPIQYLHAIHTGNKLQKEQAFLLLQDTAAEQNHILQQWSQLGIPAHNAAQSQGLIQLYNHYCSKKQCLRCAIGHYILKQ